jgi:hypothetical protein
MNKFNQRVSISIIPVIAIILTISTATSCKKTPPAFNPPTIVLDQGANYVSHDSTVARGTTIKVRVHAKATAAGLMQVVHYYGDVNTVVGGYQQIVDIPDAYRDTFDYTFTIVTSITPGLEFHSFRIIDKNNQFGNAYLQLSIK